MSLDFSLENLIRSGFPCIVIRTFEYEKARMEIKKLVTSLNLEVYTWNIVNGIKELPDGVDYSHPLELFSWLNQRENCVLIADNFHLFQEPPIIQGLINGYESWRRQGVYLVIISPPGSEFNKEIKNLIFPYEIAPPTEEEIEKLQKDFMKEYKVEADPDAVKACKGLASYQIENAIALSIILKKRIDANIIREIKKKVIGSTGFMQFWEAVDIEEVGGLDNLKTFIKNRLTALKSSQKNRIKGILLVGIPGTGKSLSAKAIANLLNWPLLKLDLGALKGSLVGESESRAREATAIADSIGEVVIWIDEIEKGLAGLKSSGETEGGVTANIFAHLLTWMQETTSPILLVATANDISALPPEFLRAGRFDAIFFVDLPNKKEREEIFKIMLKRYAFQIPEKTLKQYIELTNGWSGAEIEQLIKDAIYDGLETAFKNIVPLSVVQKERINSLRAWAATRARKANSPDEADGPEAKKRKIFKEVN